MNLQSPLILSPFRNLTLRIAPPKERRKDEKKIPFLVLLKPLYRRKSWIKSVGEFSNYTTLIRTSAAAFISERRGLNFQRFSLYAAIPVGFSVAALIFCNFSFMSAAASKSSVPSAAAFNLFLHNSDRFFTFLAPFLLHLLIPYKSKQPLIKTNLTH